MRSLQSNSGKGILLFQTAGTVCPALLTGEERVKIQLTRTRKDHLVKIETKTVEIWIIDHFKLLKIQNCCRMIGISSEFRFEFSGKSDLNWLRYGILKEIKDLN